MKKSLVSMKEVAQAAGVSKATVSNVLNRKKNVSEAVQKKVLKICENLGYKVNYNLQDFIKKSIKGETRNVAFVLVNKEFSDLAYNSLIDGISKATNDFNLHLILCQITGEEKMVYDLPPILRDGRVDGIVISGDIDTKVVGLLNKLEIPYVIAGNYSDGITMNANKVEINVFSVLNALVDSLKARGKKKIAFYIESEESYFEQLAYQSFTSALDNYDLPLNKSIIFKGAGELTSAYTSLKSVFKKKTLDFDSIICLDFRSALEISNLISAHFGFSKDIDIVIATSQPHSYLKLPVPSLYVNWQIELEAYKCIELLENVIKGNVSGVQHIKISPENTILSE